MLLGRSIAAATLGESELLPPADLVHAFAVSIEAPPATGPIVAPAACRPRPSHTARHGRAPLGNAARAHMQLPATGFGAVRAQLRTSQCSRQSGHKLDLGDPRPHTTAWAPGGGAHRQRACTREHAQRRPAWAAAAARVAVKAMQRKGCRTAVCVRALVAVCSCSLGRYRRRNLGLRGVSQG